MFSLATVTFTFLSISLLATSGAIPSAQEEDDTFFSGTVDEFTSESVTVTRVVLGNPPEHRTFSVNAQTKVEGKLSEGARVTVKFRAVDAVMLAEAIIVRDPPKPKKK